MNLDPDPRSERFRAEVRSWLASRVPDPPLPSVSTAEGFAAHRAWERALAAERLSVVSWPARYGGRDAPLEDWLVFEEEYYRAGAPVRVGQNGLFLLAPTLFAHGTAGQRPPWPSAPAQPRPRGTSRRPGSPARMLRAWRPERRFRFTARSATRSSATSASGWPRSARSPRPGAASPSTAPPSSRRSRRSKPAPGR